MQTRIRWLCCIKDNPADTLTKPQVRPEFEQLRALLKMTNGSDIQSGMRGMCWNITCLRPWCNIYIRNDNNPSRSERLTREYTSLNIWRFLVIFIILKNKRSIDSVSLPLSAVIQYEFAYSLVGFQQHRHLHRPFSLTWQLSAGTTCGSGFHFWRNLQVELKNLTRPLRPPHLHQ